MGYVSIERLRAQWHTPRREPRAKDRPPEDGAYNQAFAWLPVKVEHGIRRLRHFKPLSQTNRHRRQARTGRVCAEAGLVNYHLTHRHCQ